MPNDQDALNKDIDQILDDAVARTNKKLALQISSVTRMTQDEVQKLFPAAADAEKLLKLMQTVKSAEDMNTKVTNIMSNIESFAGIIVTLLGKFA
jgi:hypothetical protein